MTTQPLQLKHLTTKTARELSAISGELDITVAMLEKATAEKEALYRLFESLTPGGSEFHNSPQACVDFAKDRIKTTVTLAKERNELRKQLHIDRQLVDEFATLAGLAKFENEDLRRQLSEAQGIINTYSVELGKLNQEHADMRQHCETINEQLKAALAENERLRKMGRDTAV